MFNSARILGPALAGLLVAAIGEGYCFLANGLSYLAVIAGLLLMSAAGTRSRAAAISSADTASFPASIAALSKRRV